MATSLAPWAITAFLVGSTGAIAQDVRPQYSVADVQRALGPCAEAGTAIAPDGTCRPTLGADRGFALATAPNPRSKMSTFAKPKLARRNRPPAHLSTMNLRITFANASSELTAQAKANVQILAAALVSPALVNARFAIDGHTNAIGDAEFNRQLSQERANAVADALVSSGIDRSRLEVKGFGFDQPLNKKNPHAAVNRRVEGHRI